MARKAAKARKATPRRPPKRSPLREPHAADGVIADRYRLEGTYERLRRALLAAPKDGRLERPLSYWVLPTDRRLPLALLDKPLSKLLDADLKDLLQTQGVGQKKMLGLFELLRRALKTSDPHAPFGLPGAAKATRGVSLRAEHPSAADGVSEAVWRMWADTVVRVGLTEHQLGRVAPCLRDLPTVIWRKQLGEYTSLSLEEIRDLKTHGEKRVRAVLAVFGAVHEAVSTSVLDEHLDLDVQPRFVPAINRWLIQASGAGTAVTAGEFREHVTKPLLEQVKHDLGDHVAQLAESRLRGGRDAPSVREQASRLKVTRARVYQLLDDCARMASVRWPEGRWLLAPFGAEEARLKPQVSQIVTSTTTLFFP